MKKNIIKRLWCVVFLYSMTLCGCSYISDEHPHNGLKELANDTQQIDTQKIITTVDDFSVQIDDIDLLLDNEITGIVYFGRDTCSFCLTFNQYLKDEYDNIDNLVIYKFDTDKWRNNSKFQEVLNKYKIESIPSLIRVDDNKMFKLFVPKEDSNENMAKLELRMFLKGE